jgi:hypothetical protein
MPFSHLPKSVKNGNSGQNTENFRIGQIYSVEFESIEKIFSGHTLGQYWSSNLMETQFWVFGRTRAGLNR